MKQPFPPAPFIHNHGQINTRYLFEQFQQFYRDNSGSWLEIAKYQEDGPHRLLMAFLQRVVNGGGNINREYGLGRRRLD